MDPDLFDKVWQQHADFTFTEADEELCDYAAHFALWAESLYQETAEQPTLIDIYQGMYFLSRRYYEWRQVVPKSHRDRISERGHVCIFHIWERYFSQLMVLELSLAPSKLVPPSASSRPPRYEIAGVPMGIWEDDDA